uniref:Uncharacterized protein n=1 Tax=Rhizophora mucronata TaxID=61149 RepID=A0A2P2NT81_RHIMU
MLQQAPTGTTKSSPLWIESSSQRPTLTHSEKTQEDRQRSGF